MHIGALWVGTATKNRESGANSQCTVSLPIRLLSLTVACASSRYSANPMVGTGTINLPVNHYLLLKAF